MKFQKITIDFGGLLGYVVQTCDNSTDSDYQGWLETQEDTIYTHDNLEELIEELWMTAWVVLNQDSFTE